MKPDPHPSDVSSQDVADLPPKRKWFGYAAVAASIKPGKSGRVWGPYGQFANLALDQPLMPLVMIGGGIGITPFLSLVASEAFARRGGAGVTARQIIMEDFEIR